MIQIHISPSCFASPGVEAAAIAGHAFAPPPPPPPAAPQSDNARLLFLSAECLRLSELLHKADRRINRLEFGNTVLMHTVSAAGDEMARRGEAIRALKSDIATRDASRTQLHDLLRSKDTELAALTKRNAELMEALQRSQRVD